jgi:glycosyltransferase involved in cell wall biosynthesis
VKLSVVIPAYNEEDRIVGTLENTLSYLGGRPYDSEVLVVSDGSTDGTGRVVSGFTPPARVAVEFLEYHPNRGKGYAVRYGMMRGKGAVVMFMDADYAVPIAEVEKGLARIEEGFDIAIASRTHAESRIRSHQNFFRELSARFYTAVQMAYLRIPYRDTQCGFKLFTRTAAQRLFARQRLDSVIFDPEILWLAKQEGFSVVEFPVQWTHVGDSRIQYDSLRKSLFVFQELFRIRKAHR